MILLLCFGVSQKRIICRLSPKAILLHTLFPASAAIKHVWLQSDSNTKATPETKNHVYFNAKRLENRITGA